MQAAHVRLWRRAAGVHDDDGEAGGASRLGRDLVAEHRDRAGAGRCGPVEPQAVGQHAVRPKIIGRAGEWHTHFAQNECQWSHFYSVNASNSKDRKCLEKGGVMLRTLGRSRYLPLSRVKSNGQHHARQGGGSGSGLSPAAHAHDDGIVARHVGSRLALERLEVLWPLLADAGEARLELAPSRLDGQRQRHRRLWHGLGRMSSM